MKGEESIADTVERASKMPTDELGGASVFLPPIFSTYPIPNGEKIINDEPEPGAINKGIQGVPRYNFTARIKRFVLGALRTGTDDHGNPIYEEHDDSMDYEALMNSMLDGSAIIRWEDRRTLNDGAMIIVVSYLVPKKTGM